MRKILIRKIKIWLLTEAPPIDKALKAIVSWDNRLVAPIGASKNGKVELSAIEHFIANDSERLVS